MDENADIAKWEKAFINFDLDEIYLEGVVTNEDAFCALKYALADQYYNRWEAEETVTDMIIGMGYDGITHIGGGRYNKKDNTRHRVYIAFEPEQIKSIDNEYPTDDSPDIRFSLKKPVEETKNLLALHNLTEEKLSDALKLGGLPMPSIAVVKKDMGHSEYGPISLVFDKNTIDPQSDSRNKVYGGDGYTPTAPSVEYPVNYDTLRKFEKTISDLSKKVGGGVFSNDSALRRIGVEDVTDMSLNDIANKLSSDDSVRNFINKVKILQSSTVDNSITIWGQVYTDDGKPIMVAIKLDPNAKTGTISNYAVITSAYKRPLTQL